MNIAVSPLALGVNPNLIVHIASGILTSISLTDSESLLDATNIQIYDAVQSFIIETRRFNFWKEASTRLFILCCTSGGSIYMVLDLLHSSLYISHRIPSCFYPVFCVYIVLCVTLYLENLYISHSFVLLGNPVVK